MAAIKTDGTAWAWGANFLGMLGDGTEINRSSPVQVGAQTNWLQISSGFTSTLALYGVT
jgi:alpha-tubulin suppressor-like RCC1 family protein